MKKILAVLFFIASLFLSGFGSYWAMSIVEKFERFHMEDIFGGAYEVLFAPLLGFVVYTVAWSVLGKLRDFWKRTIGALLTAVFLSGVIHWFLIHFGIIGGNFGYRL